MLRIGIVGTGFMARTHAQRYADRDDVEVGAVVSRSDPDGFIEEHAPNADGYVDSGLMYRDGDVDAVDVCTPTHTHVDEVLVAADDGVDVFCEKPLARTLDGAEAIADAVAEAGVTCMVGHTLRFMQPYVGMKRRIESGAVGEVGTARARRLSPFPDWGTENWFADFEKSGGVLLDLAIHDLDYLRWVLGAVDRVFARTRRIDGREHATLTLRFADDAVGYVEASQAEPASRPFTTALEVAGDDGMVELELAEDPEQPYADPGPYEQYVRDDEPPSIESPLERDAYGREVAAFVDAVRGDREPPVTVHDGIEAMRLSLAAIESAERGEPVAPAEVGG
jgi:predicted dehydrogenase